MNWLIVLLLLGICQAFKAGGNNHECEIKLQANWNKSPFALQVVETIASFNESAYQPLMETLFGLQDEDQSVALNELTDEELYKLLMSIVDNEETKALMDIHLANKFRTPRIESHLSYYRDEVVPKFEKILQRQCGSSSSAWAVLNNNIYCSADDLFAIRVDSNDQSGSLLHFDRIIGNSDMPVIILYGDFSDKNLHELLKTLYQFSQNGQYRFVWRYMPTNQVSGKELLSGYGVDLTLKRTDYIAIDDRNQKKEIESEVPLELNDDLSPLNTYHDDIQKVFDIETLELQFTKFVLDQAADGYSNLKKVLSDFPKYASYLSTYADSIPVLQEILSHSIANAPVSPGIYINGRPVHEHFLHVGGIVSVLKQEFEFMRTLLDYGISVKEAKDFIQTFSSLQGNATSDTSPVRRYNIFNEADSVIFFNDLEKDPQYKHWKKSRKPYLNPELKPGQVPATRENVHSTVFVIRLSDPIQFNQFWQCTNFVLFHENPQQVGIVPLVKNDNDLDVKLTRKFVSLVHSEGRNAGFQYLASLASALIQKGFDDIMYDAEQLDEIIDSVSDHPDIDNLMVLNEKFAKKFNVRRSQIILNGIFYEMTDGWRYLAARQLYQDTLQIRDALDSVYPELNSMGPLREFLFKDAFQRRNTRMISDSPDFEGVVSYLSVDTNILNGKSVEVAKDTESCLGTPLTLTLVGSLGSLEFTQLINDTVKKSPECLKIRVIDTRCGSFGSDGEKIELNSLAALLLSNQENSQNKAGKCDPNFFENLGLPELAYGEVLVILNGKMLVVPQHYLDFDGLEMFIENEKLSKLDAIYNFYEEHTTNIDKSDKFTSFDEFSSKFSHMFSSPDSDDRTVFTEMTINRLCVTCLDKNNSVDFKPYNPDGKVDLTIVIKPVEEFSQKILALALLFEGFDSSLLNLKVLLQPSPALQKMNINRFYRGVYQNSIHFTTKGSLNETSLATFSDVPVQTLFTFDVDAPVSWVVGIVEGETDLDNVLLKDTGDVSGVYELENILVEGHLRSVGDFEGGIQMQLSQGDLPSVDTTSIINLGYFQLKANPGIWKLQIKPFSESLDKYVLASVDRSFSEVIPSAHTNPMIPIMDLSGALVYPVFTLKPKPNLLIQTVTNIFQNYFSRENDQSTSAEINIFSVASGHLYERFLGIMTASVMKHTKHTVKFWFIENYMSPTFKRNLPKLAQRYGFKYELITYNWPEWLRPQREKQRTIWGYKILFLDVLFPQNLDKVIFVDADQIVRTDMKELMDIDLQGAPYGYTPMCDSRSEMEGFRFWKQGYWDKLLTQNGLKYHISALYVIDLKIFRQMKAGDILREHYQALSADPASLSNLDQDLPNNLQSKIKIFSLPQEWLWCETWCSDESLKTAKTIDLCNNPLTKEPKLARARRQVSEWTSYDDEINLLLSEKEEISESLPRDEL